VRLIRCPLCPDSDQIPQRGETTRCAKERHQYDRGRQLRAIFESLLILSICANIFRNPCERTLAWTGWLLPYLLSRFSRLSVGARNERVNVSPNMRHRDAAFAPLFDVEYTSVGVARTHFVEWSHSTRRSDRNLHLARGARAGHDCSLLRAPRFEMALSRLTGGFVRTRGPEWVKLRPACPNQPLPFRPPLTDAARVLPVACYLEHAIEADVAGRTGVRITHESGPCSMQSACLKGANRRHRDYPVGWLFDHLVGAGEQ
jgi:hypothetical protein